MPNDKLLEALVPLKKELEEQRDAANAELQPLHAHRDQLVAKIQPLEAELKAANKEIKDAEERLQVRRIGNELAEIARVTGARSLRNG